MATYNMINEIRKIEELTGKTREELKERFEATTWREDEFTVWNKRTKISVENMLKDLEAKKRKEENRIERLSTFHWVKEDGEWVVDGDFTDKNVGDEIEILKASGERQRRLIYDFTQSGKAIIK